MSIVKEQAKKLIDKLPDQATWDDTFAPGKFPRIEWDRPEVVEKVMGSFPLKVRWFDGDGREVTSPDQPGRYAFYAEGTIAGGVFMLRAPLAATGALMKVFAQ